jgi:hypothetical protein
MDCGLLQRNKPDAMIILYDGEERISTAVAIKMFERGCDNVFIVTGGLSALVSSGVIDVNDCVEPGRSEIGWEQV